MKMKKNFNLQKYVLKLKKSKSAEYLIGRDNGAALSEVYHPAFDRTIEFPKEGQIAEFYSKMKHDHNYLNEEYKLLLLNIKEIDSEYSINTSKANRIGLNKKAINQWQSFIDFTKNSIPKEEITLRDDMKIKLNELWLRTKVYKLLFQRRNKITIPAEEILHFHHEFTKYYRFDIPIHAKNLAMMLHPHWGYFCKFNKREFSFEDIINHYEKEFISSHFRNIGRPLLANRITAFNFWTMVDKNKQGFLEFDDFIELLEATAFDVDTLNSENFQNEFVCTLSFLKNEFLETLNQELFRFRLYEYLFMERCAIY